MRKKIILPTIIVLILVVLLKPVIIFAQSQLDSSNYSIVDPEINNGGSISESSNYSLLNALANPFSEARTLSTSYEMKTGFPNGILANVPIIRCAETSTISGTTQCSYFPNANGAIGECGTPGCYNRAKVEIDSQNNPLDTLYIVKLINNKNNQIYYLQSDHSISATLGVEDLLTKCSIEGRDANDPACDTNADAAWDVGLQRYNIFSLVPNTSYTVSIAAINGDFTQTRFSDTKTFSTVNMSISLDLDIAAIDSESNGPYRINLGTIPFTKVTTATNKIWVDISTNAINGVNVYVKDLNNGLYGAIGNETIPSENEDLAIDPNSNGGFGLKISSYNQSSLGPLLPGTVYNTSGSSIVGAVSTTPQIILFTNSNSGNQGQIASGRASISLMARSSVQHKTDLVSDTLTFICLGNF
ncbi:MAG: hypothetical protein WCJ58_01755 [bacterium]